MGETHMDHESRNELRFLQKRNIVFQYGELDWFELCLYSFIMIANHLRYELLFFIVFGK